jgi:hypothetical protein
MVAYSVNIRETMSFTYLVVYTKEIHFTYMHPKMTQIRSHFSRSDVAVYIRTISSAKMNTDMIHFGNAEMAADIQTISSPYLANYLSGCFGGPLIWLFIQFV